MTLTIRNLILIAGAVASSALVQAQTLTADVPFAFRTNETSHNPGKIEVTRMPGAASIYKVRAGGKTEAILLSVTSKQRAAADEFRFAYDGETYRLVEVCRDGASCQQTASAGRSVKPMATVALAAKVAVR